MNIKTIFIKRYYNIKIILILVGIAVFIEATERILDYIWGDGHGVISKYNFSMWVNIIQNFIYGYLFIVPVYFLIKHLIKIKIINWFSFILSMILIIILLELYGKYALNHNPVDRYTNFMNLSDFEEKTEFIQNRKDYCNNSNLQYFDYHIYAYKPVNFSTISFTDYYSAREVPDSELLGKGDIIIWIFGGSTMQNLETTDKLSIANQLAINLKNESIKATVINFGVGSFQSCLESIKFQDILRRIPHKEFPNFVIFYDGFNDAGHAYMFGAGAIQADISKKMKALVEKDYSRIIKYSFSQILSKYSNFWKSQYSVPLEWELFNGWKKDTTSINLRKAIHIYKTNTKMISAICKEFNIKPLFVLQPMIFTKEKLTEAEENQLKILRPDKIRFMKTYFNNVRNEMDSVENFYDLTHIFNNSGQPDFYDEGHTGPTSSITTGYELSKLILNIYKNGDN